MPNLYVVFPWGAKRATVDGHTYCHFEGRKRFPLFIFPKIQDDQPRRTANSQEAIDNGILRDTSPRTLEVFTIRATMTYVIGQEGVLICDGKPELGGGKSWGLLCWDIFPFGAM